MAINANKISRRIKSCFASEMVPGRVFGSLTILKYLGVIGEHSRVLCLCKCGTKKILMCSNLVKESGPTISCGCVHKERASLASTKHGMRKSLLYRRWVKMRERCYWHSYNEFEHYGGRGINVCEEWKNSFVAFRDWALANGYEDGLSLERIDVNGNYTPANCCWIPRAHQAKNRQNTIVVDSVCLADKCRSLGVKYQLIYNRIKQLGWSVDKALNTPARKVRK